MIADALRCSKKIWDRYGVRRCSRRGSVLEDRKYWCRQHVPSSAKAAADARYAAYIKKLDVEVSYKTRAAECFDACASIPNPRAIPELIEALKDLEWSSNLDRRRVEAIFAKAGIK